MITLRKIFIAITLIACELWILTHFTVFLNWIPADNNYYLSVGMFYYTDSRPFCSVTIDTMSNVYSIRLFGKPHELSHYWSYPEM